MHGLYRLRIRHEYCLLIVGKRKARSDLHFALTSINTINMVIPFLLSTCGAAPVIAHAHAAAAALSSWSCEKFLPSGPFNSHHNAVASVKLRRKTRLLPMYLPQQSTREQARFSPMCAREHHNIFKNGPYHRLTAKKQVRFLYELVIVYNKYAPEHGRLVLRMTAARKPFHWQDHALCYTWNGTPIACTVTVHATFTEHRVSRCLSVSTTRTYRGR